VNRRNVYDARTPEEQAAISFKGAAGLEAVRMQSDERMEGLKQKNRIALLEREYGNNLGLLREKAKSDSSLNFQLKAREKLIDTDWDLIKTAVTSLPPELAGGANDALGKGDMGGLAALLGSGATGNVETDRKIAAGIEALNRQSALTGINLNYGLNEKPKKETGVKRFTADTLKDAASYYGKK
jgi:hypothetical protein